MVLERERRLVIGLDGGGTKTVCLVANLDGKPLGRGLGGPSNYLSEGLDRARKSIEDAILGALESAGADRGDIACLCAGLAGVSRPRDHETMRATLQRILIVPELILETDGVIALVGGTGGRAGVIVASGTGSVAFGIDPAGRRARSGGWGFILGDEGSGYDIARRGMIAALREYDGRGETTVIRRKIGEVLELKSTEDLIPLLYANPLSPGRVAALYPLVLDAADEGDSVALRLINNSAAALAEMGVATARKLDFSGTRMLVTTAGGVFRGQNLRKAFIAEMARQMPEAEVIEPAGRAEEGAVMMAAARVRGERSFTDLITPAEPT